MLSILDLLEDTFDDPLEVADATADDGPRHDKCDGSIVSAIIHYTSYWLPL